MILTLRTDKPDAEIGLYKAGDQVDYASWQGHRQLAETLHLKVKEMLDKNHLDWPDINGIVCYQGPGSFTGLRIGLSFANALAYSNQIPIVGVSGEDWLKVGLKQIPDAKYQNNKIVLPEYGMDPHITAPKK